MIKNIKCDTEVAGPALSHHSPIPAPMTLQRNSPPGLSLEYVEACTGPFLS